MRITNISKTVISGVVLLSPLILSACDEKENKTIAAAQERKICYVDVGGSFGKSGIRARQYVGSGPKFKVVQWKTLDFPDKIVTSKAQLYYNRYPSIAVQVSWRVSLINGNVESSFESMEAKLINLKPEDIKRVRKWRISIIDNEKYEFNANDISKTDSTELFSTEARGIIIPPEIGDSIGGVNGNSFKIAAIDANGKIIVEKTIYVARGYEFKGRAKSAAEELQTIVENPQSCQTVKG